jgi:hypothetical protein
MPGLSTVGSYGLSLLLPGACIGSDESEYPVPRRGPRGASAPVPRAAAQDAAESPRARAVPAGCSMSLTASPSTTVVETVTGHDDD